MVGQATAFRWLIYENVDLGTSSLEPIWINRE